MTYSLGEPRVDPATGKPNTFAFGFKGLADAPAVNPQARNYVAIGNSTTTGHSVTDCYDPITAYPYGCPVEPGPAPAYPDLVANELGAPYSDDYKVAEKVDYRTADPSVALPSTPPYFNRVGVWGYEASQALEQYDKAEARGDDRRERYASDNNYVPGPWEDQLHAAQDAEDLLTVSFGINDMEFNEPSWFIAYYRQLWEPGFLDKRVAEEIEGTNGEPALRDSLDRLFGEFLRPARDRGAEVAVTGYPGLVEDKPGCRDSFVVNQKIVNAVNKELRDRSDGPREGARVTFVDIDEAWRRDGKDHGLGGDEPWVFGTNCNAAAILSGGLPDWTDPSDLEGRDGVGQAGDPHPNEAGQIAIAEEVVKTVKEETND